MQHEVVYANSPKQRRKLKEEALISTPKDLLDLPIDIFVKNICFPFLSGTEIRALSCLNWKYYETIKQNDVIFKYLYEVRHSLSQSRAPPNFPHCGSYRDVYLRAIKGETLILVRTLTRRNHLERFIMQRGTPLFVLKKEIRRKQRKKDSVLVEDFELIDEKNGKALGIEGNDSLPPSDLSRLFLVERRREEDEGRMGMLINNLFSLAEESGWRRTISSLPDGVTFTQVFSKSFEKNFEKEKFEKIKNILGRKVENAKEYSEALLESQRVMGANAYKLFLDGYAHEEEEKDKDLRRGFVSSFSREREKENFRLHPLLVFAFEAQPGRDVRERVFAVVYFFKSFLHLIFRFRFVLDVLMRGLFSSGFLMAFSKLSFHLYPMVYKTQIKPMLDADFDFIFALRLVNDIVRLLFREFSPVLFSSFLVEFLRIFLRQVLMKERERESFYVLLFLSYLEISNRIAWAFLNANKLGEREEFSFRWFLFQIVYQRKSDRISVPLYLQYSLSSLSWFAIEKLINNPAISVSLPVYAYTIPIIACAVVLRVRIFLAQSYISLLLA